MVDSKMFYGLKCNPFKKENDDSTVESMDCKEAIRKHSNDLWQLGTTYCSYIIIDGKKHRMYLIMIIDDYSQMIVGYGFFLADNAVNVQTVLKRAIRKYGTPKRLYFGNRPPYKNEQLSLIIAQLQIEISRYQAQSYLEQAFKTVRQQWMNHQDFSVFQNTQEIEESFNAYVSSKNNRIHRSLNEKTPLQVFMADSDRIRRIDKEIKEINKFVEVE